MNIWSFVYSTNVAHHVDEDVFRLVVSQLELVLAVRDGPRQGPEHEGGVRRGEAVHQVEGGAAVAEQGVLHCSQLHTYSDNRSLLPLFFLEKSPL